jgi:hypothetical protein
MLIPLDSMTPAQWGTWRVHYLSARANTFCSRNTRCT